MEAEPDSFLKSVTPYRQDLAVAVECIYTWYWLADLCADEGIRLVLGHTLYMKAIHGGKAKNDKIDALKIRLGVRRARAFGALSASSPLASAALTSHQNCERLRHDPVGGL